MALTPPPVVTVYDNPPSLDLPCEDLVRDCSRLEPPPPDDLVQLGQVTEDDPAIPVVPGIDDVEHLQDLHAHCPHLVQPVRVHVVEPLALEDDDVSLEEEEEVVVAVEDRTEVSVEPLEMLQLRDSLSAGRLGKDLELLGNAKF